MTPSTEISARIVEAVLARKLAPGTRLNELQLCTLFDAPRAVVRDALARLSVRGIVRASARRGWYLADLSAEEAGAAFQARHVIETGLVRCAGPIDTRTLQRLRAHVRRQKAALKGTDVGLRSFLLGDFHVCLAECLGNGVLAEVVLDLTVRTMLLAVHHQSAEDAARSCDEHAAIVAALEAQDLALAESRVSAHLTTWDAKLPVPAPAPAEPDPLAELREALQPVTAGR